MKFALAFLSGIVLMLLVAAVTKINENKFPVVTTCSSLLFLGCGNEVRIDLPEENKEPEYTVTGTAIIKGSERGSLILIPELARVNLSVSYGDVTREYRFIALTPPAPDINFTMTEGKIPDMKLGMSAPGPTSLTIKAEATSLLKTLLPKDARYKVNEWHVIAVRGKRPVAQQRFTSDTGDLSSFQNTVVSGDRIMIEVIKVSRVDFKGIETEVNMKGKTTIFNIPLY